MIFSSRRGLPGASVGTSSAQRELNAASGCVGVAAGAGVKIGAK